MLGADSKPQSLLVRADSRPKDISIPRTKEVPLGLVLRRIMADSRLGCGLRHGKLESLWMEGLEQKNMAISWGHNLCNIIPKTRRNENHEVAVYQKNGNIFFRTTAQKATTFEQRQLDATKAKLQQLNSP
ncbi:hypothetical protein TEA_008462 [Camellia sinensis var. sinensis]|uniref:Uncharacterized protein n=1 Tax=Camellia sinensis var. sinensis TaxID=542762 RepID=A0A4S4EH80_CAMSN|nr:hypothetical protein TEA_008462 [Camellia sinensis var. sinensis]